MFTGLRQTVKPKEHVLTLQEAKDYLRIDSSDDEAMLLTLVSAAQNYCEEYCRLSFLEQTWTATFESWPAKGLELPRPPLLAVTSVQYRDDVDGSFVTVGPSDYDVDLYEWPSRLVHKGTIPTTGDYRGAWQVVYTAGYGDEADSVPDDIKAAVMLMLKALHDREEQTGALHKAVRNMLDRRAIPLPF